MLELRELFNLNDSKIMKKRAKALNVVWFFHNPAINGWVTKKPSNRALARIHEFFRLINNKLYD